MVEMDQKCVKKMKKRKELDKLIGNGRKHIRKKSGHMLLRTDSQSSISSDEVDQMSSIRYKRSRCSSFLMYANFFLSLCLLIVCCVLIVIVFVMRTDLDALQRKVHTVNGNYAQKFHDVQKIHNHVKLLQEHVQDLNKNFTEHRARFKKTFRKVSLLEEEIHHIRSSEQLVDSLSNLPSEMSKAKKNLAAQSIIIHRLKKKMSAATLQILKLMNDTSKLNQYEKEFYPDHVNRTPCSNDHNEKASRQDSVKRVSSENTATRIDNAESHMFSLQRNLSDITLRLLKMEKGIAENSGSHSTSDNAKKTSSNETFVSADDFHSLLERVVLIETFLQKLEMKFENFTSNLTFNRKQMTGAVDQRSLLSPKHTSIDSLLSGSTNLTLKKIVTDVKMLNSSLQHLLENLPDARLTLGYGVQPSSSPTETLGEGVILRRDEYFKLRKYWAKASQLLLATVRIDNLEKKFENLKKQLASSVKSSTNSVKPANKTARAEVMPEKNQMPAKETTSANSEESKSSSSQQPPVSSTNSPVKKIGRLSASLQETGVEAKSTSKPVADEANANKAKPIV